MKKKPNVKPNVLERIPVRRADIEWNTDDGGAVTLLIENKGMFNRIAQKLFKKPKISHIHLDEMGSFIWPRLNGEKNLIALGEEVRGQFGEKAEPLYERLAQYVQILDSYHFISWVQ